jgi:phage gp29-like protein
MTLFDGYGREVDLSKLREEQAGPTLTGVRNIYSVMHPAAGLTPEKLTSILRQAEFGDPFLYLELAEEMEEKDLHYLAVLNTRKQALAQLEIVIRPASKAAEDVRIAEMANDLLLGGALDIENSVFEILDAIGKGFSASEIIWDTSGREWYPRRIVLRDPRWFLFDWISGEDLLVRTMDGETAAIDDAPRGGGHLERAMTARGGVDGGAWSGMQPFTAPLRPFKFIVHFAKAKSGLPIRGGLARAAGWAYLFKNYVLKDWVTFAEVFGQPLRLGKYGSGASEADKSTLLQAVANIGTDAAAIIPDSMVIEFTQARQAGSAELYERFCEYIDRQTSKAVLGQTLTTELPRGGGSRAAAQIHDGVRKDILGADARRLAATLTRDLIKPIVDLNAGPQKRYPHVQFAMPDNEDAKTFADIVCELADRGLRIGQDTVLERLGLPNAGEDDATLHPAPSRG